MKNFKQLIKELPSSKVVVAFGSFQPPTLVHEHLIKSVKTVAGSSADYAIYASANEDKKYNPLSVDRKVYFLNRMFPGTNFQETAEQTIVGLAKKLNEKYKVLTVVVGEDKVADVTKQLTKANGKEYTFESIKVISTGMTDPDSDVTPGVSGLRMCESAKAGKFEDFKKGLPHTLTEHDSRRLMNEVRKGLGQEPIKEQVVLAKDKIREEYFAGKIFNVGDIVESNGQQYEIVKRGSNHLLLKEESGALVSKWIQDVMLVTEKQETDMTKEVSKETIRKKYKEILKKSTMSEPPVEIGEPVKGDGKEQPKFGDKSKKNESNFTEDVYTSDTKTKDYMAKDAEGNWVWRKRKIHPKRINFANSKMGGAPENVPTTMPTEGYVKKTAYEKLNNRMKTLTGKSLDDRSKEWEKERQETLDRIKKYKDEGIINKEHIEKVAGGYEVESEHGNKNLGKYKSLAGAKKRLKQVEYFKHMAEETGAYEKAEENKKSADAAKKQGDMFAHHLHMADYHDNLSQWHGEKGRNHSADSHMKKAEEHHNQAMKLKEEFIVEGKMGQIHADIEDHLGKHLQRYKEVGGAEHFAGKTVNTAKHISKLHGLKPEHAQKLVNDYVDSNLKEEFIAESDTHELGIRHDEPLSRHEHIKSVMAKHGAKVSGSSDKSTYFKIDANKVEAAKKELKAGRVHADHWINGDFQESVKPESYGSWILKQKASKTIKQKPETKAKVEESVLNPKDPHGDYKAKKKALQDIQLDPHTHKDKQLAQAVMQRHADLDKEYQKYSKINVSEEKKTLKNLKKEIKDKESLQTINKNPPFDAFSSTNC